MDKTSISFKFQAAIAHAEELERIAAQMDRNGEKLAESMNQTVSGWRAGSGAVFRKKGGRLEDQMEDTSSHLRKLAAAVREIARRMYETEMANLALAQERSYE